AFRPDLHIAGAHLFDGPAGLHRARLGFEQIVAAGGLRILVLGLDQQPVLLAAALAALHAHEVPAPLELAAAELELEVALGQLLVRVALGRPASTVPDDDAAGAVLALGDAPLELGIIERVVLDVNG